jgi:hypothetical protein
MTVKITTANGGSDSLDFGCAQTAIVATVTGTEVSSGEGKLELKTTTGGTSAAKMTIAANGTVTLAAPLPVASGGTGSTTGAIYLQTAVATTSGTEIDFTSIPAGVNRINIMFAEVSISGTSLPMIQIGDSGGLETTGYKCVGALFAPSSNANTAYTTGITIKTDATAATLMSGTIVANRITGNEWCFHGCTTNFAPANYAAMVSGYKSLSGELTTVRLTAVNGSDTFDAGKVSISWEF